MLLDFRWAVVLLALLLCGSHLYYASLQGGSVEWLHERVYLLIIRLIGSVFCFTLYSFIAITMRSDLLALVSRLPLYKQMQSRRYSYLWRAKYDSLVLCLICLLMELLIMIRMFLYDTGQDSFKHGAFNCFCFLFAFILGFFTLMCWRFLWIRFYSQKRLRWVLRGTTLGVSLVLTFFIWRWKSGMEQWGQPVLDGSTIHFRNVPCQIDYHSWIPVYDLFLGFLSLDMWISPLFGESTCDRGYHNGITQMRWLNDTDQSQMEIDSSKCECTRGIRNDKVPFIIEALPLTHDWSRLDWKYPMTKLQNMIEQKTQIIPDSWINRVGKNKNHHLWIADVSRLQSQVFLVTCHPKCTGVSLSDFSAKKQVIMRVQNKMQHKYVNSNPPPPRPSSLPDSPSSILDRWNIDILYIDAISRRHFQRVMPLSRSKLSSLFMNSHTFSNLTLMEMIGFHSVGAYTKPNSLPLWAGKGFVNHAWSLNSQYRTLWRFLRDEMGYRTSRISNSCEDFGAEYQRSVDDHAWDDEMISLFCDERYYLQNGAKGNFRGPFSLRRRCLYGRMVHEYLFDFHEQLIKMNEHESMKNQQTKKSAQFIWSSLTEAHEGTGEVIRLVDQRLANFLDQWSKQMNNKQDRVLVLMSDHGLHMHPGYALQMKQPRTEVMLPLLIFIFPQRFVRENPELIENLRVNQQRVVTPYDFFHTMMHLGSIQRGRINSSHSHFQHPANGAPHAGISLFNDHSKQRRKDYSLIPMLNGQDSNVEQGCPPTIFPRLCVCR